MGIARALLALGLACLTAATPQYYPSPSPASGGNSGYDPGFFDSNNNPTPAASTPAASCTSAAATAILDAPLFFYPEAASVFVTVCPKYSFNLPLPFSLCPHLCLMPPADSAFSKKFSLVPEAYSFCAFDGVSSGEGPLGLTYTYDAGTAGAVTRPCVPCPPPLPLPAAVPGQSQSVIPPAVLVAAGQMLRFDCGSRVSRKPGTCNYLCGVPEFEINKSQGSSLPLPKGIGRCTNSVSFDKSGFFKNSFFPGQFPIKSVCKPCADDCDVVDLPDTPVSGTLDGVGIGT